MTHTALQKSSRGHRETVKIRETKLYWVDEDGFRFRKHDGRQPGRGIRWTDYWLVLDTIRPLSV